MQKIVEGTIEPYEGCGELNAICIELEYPAELYNWSALYWEERERRGEKLDALIIDEARRYLAGERAERISELFTIEAAHEQTPSFWNRLKNLFSGL